MRFVVFYYLGERDCKVQFRHCEARSNLTEGTELNWDCLVPRNDVF